MNNENQVLSPVDEAIHADAEQEAPRWLLNGVVDEVLFCEDLLTELPMVCMNRKFFGVDGWIADEGLLKSEIYKRLKPYIHNGLAKKVPALLDVLKSEAYCA